jgi:hypothetical protein
VVTYAEVKKFNQNRVDPGFWLYSPTLKLAGAQQAPRSGILLLHVRAERNFMTHFEVTYQAY